MWFITQIVLHQPTEKLLMYLGVDLDHDGDVHFVDRDLKEIIMPNHYMKECIHTHRGKEPIVALLDAGFLGVGNWERIRKYASPKIIEAYFAEAYAQATRNGLIGGASCT